MRSMWHGMRERLSDERGAATAEYAIVIILPVLRVSRHSTSPSRTLQRPDETPRSASAVEVHQGRKAPAERQHR